MKRFFKKLFCLHKWKTHVKEKYSWDETKVVHGTETWYHPITEKHKYSSVTEMLICSECGKIKKIEY